MRSTLIFLTALGILPAVAQQRPFERNLREHEQTLAPFVASPQVVVDKMLAAAGLKPGETMYDLGCGDGRVLITAAQKFKAKAVGVELSAALVAATNQTVKRLNLQDQVKVIHGHLLEANLAPADVVTLYLDTATNEQLKPNLESQLKHGARVVSHDYEIRGWKPVKVEKIEVYKRPHTIYVYVMPPKF
ncbi:MAG: class I SAM-dependent methyltransferase [Acidobacteria bacterium]|nr:class I SAM-dependent methyltransferase [Acidobacteriota bacterium]MBI3278214.1 class I SAM-dependent methyltransferase [Acidobacteriota bacterium]